MAVMVIIGVCLIVYVGLAIVYLQQEPKQEELEKQINKTFLIVSKPLPSMKELQTEYDEVNLALAPMPVPEVLETIVGIARESGIDVEPAGGKFHIPPPSEPKEKKMAVGTYEIISFQGIKAQGDYDSVMAFIADLDSGKTKQNMVLKRVGLSQVEIKLDEEEAERRAEFRAVLSAVSDMMAENGITEIPNPINYEGGTATNDMMAFSDNTTTAAEKGYTGTGTPKAGYLLHQHDRIFTDNTTEFETVDYITIPTTLYYYTCEADGSVRQFDGPDIATATEYFSSKEVDIETVAVLNVDLYTKPVKE
ncbi:MAG: hypothetical protein E3J40_02145 [Dehalococcoidia bacterium]|nr:MAG: hypothetical protein E3J40_02145 [Dehalococcoidia bacterium]